MLQFVYNIKRNFKDNLILSFVSLLYNYFVINKFKSSYIIIFYIDMF